MPEITETIKYDPESMCLPNSIEFAVKKLLGKEADRIDFTKYRLKRAAELVEEVKYTSPINTAKRENQNEIPLIAANRDEYVKFVLDDINKQTDAHIESHTERISEEDISQLAELIRQSKTVCLLSLMGHIEPIAVDEFDGNVIKKKISHSYEMVPLGNVTVISQK